MFQPSNHKLFPWQLAVHPEAVSYLPGIQKDNNLGFQVFQELHTRKYGLDPNCITTNQNFTVYLQVFEHGFLKQNHHKSQRTWRLFIPQGRSCLSHKETGDCPWKHIYNEHQLSVNGTRIETGKQQPESP